MNYSLSHKTKEFFWLLIKLSLVIGSGYYIYLKLAKNEEIYFINFYQKLIKNDLFSTKTLLFFSFLSIFNWFLEILKWQNLASFCKKTNFKDAAIQSLASLTASLITPNRIGEYGAKALYFEKKSRKKIVVLNFIGNFYLLIATLFFGFIGFTYFIIQQPTEINFLRIFRCVILVFCIIFTLFIIRKHIHFKISYLKKTCIFFKKMPLNLHLKIMLFSFIRFIIFSHQFYFLLLFLHPDILYIDAISSIASMYLITSITPMLSIFDLVLKSSVAIWVFSFFNIEPHTIVTITTLMWILNFVFPASIGSYFVITFKPNFIK